MAGFLDNPRSTFLRRAVFQVHLWMGVAVGLYLFLICVTGAALVFRIDLQRVANPELFVAQGRRPLADAATVLRELRAAYPNGRIAGVDAPTSTRPSYLAYVSDASTFRTVLIEPATAKVLGELSDHSPIRTLQALHFNLLLGKTGTLINGIGALCLLTLCLSGLVIWWQGRRRWRRGLSIRWSARWPQINWELHSAVGIWVAIVIGIWAITSLSFTFPTQFRSAVNSFSAITVRSPPTSAINVDGVNAALSWDALITRAQTLVPAQHVARVVLPARQNDAFQVLFARQQPTPASTRDFTTIYLDQYTGEQLMPAQQANTMGDAIMAWVGPLHVGSFGGLGIKWLWAVLGLSPPLLFVTGIVSWWRRVVRPAYLRMQNMRTPGVLYERS